MNLKELRESRNIGVREAARRMGTSHPAVIVIEKSGNASLETFERYAAAIGVSFDEIREAAQVTREQNQPKASVRSDPENTVTIS